MGTLTCVLSSYDAIRHPQKDFESRDQIYTEPLDETTQSKEEDEAKANGSSDYLINRPCVKGFVVKASVRACNELRAWRAYYQVSSYNLLKIFSN